MSSQGPLTSVQLSLVTEFIDIMNNCCFPSGSDTGEENDMYLDDLIGYTMYHENVTPSLYLALILFSVCFFFFFVIGQIILGTL